MFAVRLLNWSLKSGSTRHIDANNLLPLTDRRYLAKERLEELERICKGSMPTLRHAKSHLLLGFQLREARRLSYLFETLLARERGLGGSQRQDAEMATNEVFLNMQGALQIGIDAARHEIAMAEILSIHGEKVVTEVEGRKPRDSRFSSRTDWVLKEIKKDQVRDALIRQKSAGSATSGSLPKNNQGNQGPRNTRGRRGHKIPFWRDQSLSVTGQVKIPKPPSHPPKCYNCGGVGHLTRDCPKKKAT